MDGWDIHYYINSILKGIKKRVWSVSGFVWFLDAEICLTKRNNNNNNKKDNKQWGKSTFVTLYSELPSVAAVRVLPSLPESEAPIRTQTSPGWSQCWHAWVDHRQPRTVSAKQWLCL